MTYETIITIICVLLASTILLISYRLNHWRKCAERHWSSFSNADRARDYSVKRARHFEGQFKHLFERFQIVWTTNQENEQRVDLANARADRAEAALARVEAEIAKTGTKPFNGPAGTNIDLAAAKIRLIKTATKSGSPNIDLAASRIDRINIAAAASKAAASAGDIPKPDTKSVSALSASLQALGEAATAEFQRLLSMNTKGDRS